MLYWLFQTYEALWSGTPLRVFQYITVRTVAAAGTAFVISVIIGPAVIRILRKLKLGQYIRNSEAPDLYKIHESKQGTPTMGGVLIIFAITISMLLWGDLANMSIWLVLMSLIYMGLVGFLDDYKSIRKKRSKGLGSKSKLLLQMLWTLFVVYYLNSVPERSESMRQLMVPFFKEPVISDMGVIAAFLFLVAVIVGCSNAVNLTDGLDGLAIGCSSSVAITYLIMSYAAGHFVFADHLNIPYIPGAGELAVFCGALLGACLGFLWFNCHPAQVFMGDTGSLALGGSIAMVAVLIKQEIVLIIVGGVFVMEAVSVILQVLSFKLTGKRIFAMAPLHHHFEIKKWSETQVVVRFWILSIIFALLGVLTLKIR
ncbi:phospho-N-acetylmuramoyl-pentapeptide-transferase [bacterium E08(2017)]|nr:phospho-N-acetylmuramoyl-pentapeptide-transferase [bacterium E08(2017)]